MCLLLHALGSRRDACERRQRSHLDCGRPSIGPCRRCDIWRLFRLVRNASARLASVAVQREQRQLERDRARYRQWRHGPDGGGGGVQCAVSDDGGGRPALWRDFRRRLPASYWRRKQRLVCRRKRAAMVLAFIAARHAGNGGARRYRLSGSFRLVASGSRNHGAAPANAGPFRKSAMAYR